MFTDGAAVMEERSPGASDSRHHLEPSDIVGVGLNPELTTLPFDLLATTLEVWRARISRESIDLHDTLDAIDQIGQELGYPAPTGAWSARFSRLNQRDPMTPTRFASVLRSREVGNVLVETRLRPRGADVLVAMRCLRHRRGDTGSRNRRLLADVLTAAAERLDLTRTPNGRRMLNLLWLSVHPHATTIDDDVVDEWIERWLAVDHSYADRVLRRLALAEANAGGDIALALDLFVVEPEAWESPVDVDRLDELMPASLGQKIVDWCLADPDPKTALRLYSLYCSALRGNERCALELSDWFSSGLSFGTGGIRGRVGLGPAHVNAMTVSAFADALARVVVEPALSGDVPVVIGFDARVDSPDFALLAAHAVAAAGVKVKLFESATHTPQWAFAVAKTGASAGIMVTASHNRASDNGLKFADASGGQLVARFDKLLLRQVAEYRGTPRRTREDLDRALQAGGSLQESPMINVFSAVSADVEGQYLAAITSKFELTAEQQPVPVRAALKAMTVAYSPLFGLAGRSASAVARSLGITNWREVIEQSVPDGRFPSLESPNPEEGAAWRQVLALGESTHAHLCMLHDPDGDRLGVAYRDVNNAFVRVGSDDIAALLVDRLLGSWRSKSRPAVAASLVSSPLIQAIVTQSGALFCETGPGYRRVRESAGELLVANPDAEFCFGYEAAHGYGFGGAVAEKDGITAGGLMLCIAADLSCRGMTLGDGVRELQARYGFWYSAQRSVSLRDPVVEYTIDTLLERLLAGTVADEGIPATSTTPTPIAPTRLGAQELREVSNIGSGVVVLHYGEHDRVLLRRSGTESRLKLYVHRLVDAESVLGSTGGDRGRVETDRCADDVLAWLLAQTQRAR